MKPVSLFDQIKSVPLRMKKNKPPTPIVFAQPTCVLGAGRGRGASSLAVGSVVAPAVCLCPAWQFTLRMS